MLPLEKTQIESRLAKQVILVYGPPKIGKSTLCSKFDNPVFLATEPGLNHLSVYKVVVNNWEKFLEACKDLSEGKHSFSTVIVDTVDNLVAYCTEFVCKREKINHPSDYDYGKGWSMITKELHRALAKLSMLPYGLVLVSHAKTEEFKGRTKVYNKTTLTITGENRRVVLSLVDIILFLTIKEEDGKEMRVIKTKPSTEYEAGDRSNLLPPEMPLSYEELKKYFK